MKKYHYFFSYCHQQGYAMMEITSEKEITQYTQLLEMAKFIGKKYKVGNVAILNYQLLRIEE